MSGEGGNDELRGSTPVYTAKDVLVRVESKVDALDSKIDTLGNLMPHDLDARLRDLEASRAFVRGLAAVSGLVATIAAIASVIAIIVSLSPA